MFANRKFLALAAFAVMGVAGLAATPAMAADGYGRGGYSSGYSRGSSLEVHVDLGGSNRHYHAPRRVIECRPVYRDDCRDDYRGRGRGRDFGRGRGGWKGGRGDRC